MSERVRAPADARPPSFANLSVRRRARVYDQPHSGVMDGALRARARAPAHRPFDSTRFRADRRCRGCGRQRLTSGGDAFKSPPPVVLLLATFMCNARLKQRRRRRPRLLSATRVV